jgi:hypothetical protein
MTEEDQEAMDLVREKIEEMFPNSPIMSGEEMKREKEAARVRDWERIARGEATPEDIQRENSFFTSEQVKTFRIVNLEQVLERMGERR